MQRFFYILFTSVGLVANAQSFPLDLNKSLRIDFYLSGDANSVEVIVKQLKKEPHWGGSKTNLIFPNYGDFCLKLIEEKTQKVVFSKGFSSLFGEWQHIDAAKTEKRMFLHVIQTPFPSKIVKLAIEKRNKNGNFDKIFEKIINPNDYFIKNESVAQFPVKKLLDNGDSSKKVDLVILAEGYTESEMEKFYSDAKRMTDYMFTIPPFDVLKKEFNIYAIGVSSPESGTDIPGKNTYKQTVFDTSFYIFDMERYITTNSMTNIADVASLVPYDQIYVLVNTATYGGSGFYNHFSLATADHYLSNKVFVHEFGHGFAGLADEYYTSSTAFDSMYNKNVEPWEQNITSLVDFDSKWKDLMKKSTPIPTPRTPKYEKTVGVFEGGGYVAEGIYSPAQDCRMKSNDAKGFCPVCERTIRNVVKFLTE